MWQKGKYSQFNKEKGQVAIIAVLVVSLIMVSVVFAISKMSLDNYEMADLSLSSTQAYFLAESGIEEGIYRLKDDLNYTGGNYDTPIGNYVIEVTDNTTYYTVRAEGHVGGVVRAITANLSISVESAKITGYSAFAGDDVWMFWSNAIVNGDVWANDDVDFSSNSTVYGDVISAGRGSYFTSWVSDHASILDNPATADRVEGNFWSVNQIRVILEGRVAGDAYSENEIITLLGGHIDGTEYPDQDLTAETERIEVPMFDFSTYEAQAQAGGTFYATATQFENYVNSRNDGSTRTLPDGVYYIRNGNVFFNPGPPIVLNGSIITEGEIRFYCGVQINAQNNLPALAAAKDAEFRDYGWPTYGGDFVTINGVLYSERDIILRHDSSGKLIEVNGAAWAGDDLRIENSSTVNFLPEVTQNVIGFGFTVEPGQVSIDNWQETL